MKELLLILILTLCFHATTKAGDIRDFQIEGISIGDSALDYFSKEEININIDKNMFKGRDGKFTASGVYRKFGEYDGIQLAFKTNDNKKIIHSISGGIFYSDIKKCKKKLKLISRETSELFKDASKNFDVKQYYPADKSGKSYAISDTFFFDSGSISIRCTDWSDEFTEKYSWNDNLRVGIKSKEIDDWLLKKLND